jgi:hypothetical protein
MGSVRYKVSLRIKHPDLDLSDVCRDLGLTPKHIWKAGDQRRTPKGTILPGNRDSSYCSVPFDDSGEKYLSGKINYVLNALIPHRSILETVSLSGGDISVSIGWFSSGDSGDTVDSMTLKKMADLRISVELYIYCEDADVDADG